MMARHHVAVAAALCVPLARVATANALPPCTFLVRGTGPVGVALGCLLLLLGSLLPDADTADSLIGCYLRLPGQHRTWTHAVWVPAALFALGALGAWPMTWLAIGWLCHVACDALSRAGVCWLWPLVDYIRYPSGAFVAPGHWLKLYRTGRDSVSEKVVTVVLAMALVAIGVLLPTT